MNYETFYYKLRAFLIEKSDNSTTKVTKNIKDFVVTYFNDDKNKVVYTSGINQEFLYDVSVLTYNPNNLLKCKNSKFNITYNKVEAFMILESELGGTSASGPQKVFKNAIFDFSKLLVGNSNYKIMIMGVSPYRNEKNFIQNRISIINDIYKSSNNNTEMLVIVLEGNHTNGNSRQIKLKINNSSIHGFKLSQNGINEIDSKVESEYA